MTILEYKEFSNQTHGVLFDIAFRTDPFYQKIKNNVNDIDTLSVIGAEGYKKRLDKFYREVRGSITIPLFGYKFCDIGLKKKSGVILKLALMTLTDDVARAEAKMLAESKIAKEDGIHCVIKLVAPYSKIYYHHVFALDPNYRTQRNVTINAFGLNYKIINVAKD